MNRSDTEHHTEPPACDLGAIPANQRADHITRIRTLFGGRDSVRQLANGLEATLTADLLAEAASFIDNERRCCRHLTFALEVPADGAPLVLRVTGPGAAEELQAFLH